MSEIPQYPEDIPEPGPPGEPADGDTGDVEFDFFGGSELSLGGGEESLDLSLYVRGLGETDNPMIAPDDGWADNAEPGDFVLESAERLPAALESLTALDLPAEDRETLYGAIKELTTGAPIIHDGTISYHEWRIPRDLADQYGIEYDVSLVCDPVDFAVSGSPRVYGIEARMPLGTETVIDQDGSMVTYTAEQRSSVMLTRDTDVPEGIDPGICIQEESSIFVDCRRAVVDDAGETTHVALTGRTEASPLTFDEVGNIIDAAVEAARRRAVGLSESPAEAPETIPQELSVSEHTAKDIPKQEREEFLVALELFAQGGEEYDTGFAVISEDGVGLLDEGGFERELPAELLAEHEIEYDDVFVTIYQATSPEDPYFVEVRATREVPCYVNFPVGEDGTMERRVIGGTELKIVTLTPNSAGDGAQSTIDIDTDNTLEADYPEWLLAELDESQLEAAYVVGWDDVPPMTLEEVRAINSAIVKANATPPDSGA